MKQLRKFVMSALLSGPRWGSGSRDLVAAMKPSTR